MRKLTRLAAATTLMLALVASAGCSSGSGSSAGTKSGTGAGSASGAVAPSPAKGGSSAGATGVGATGGARTVTVEITKQGCAVTPGTLPAGRVTVEVTNHSGGQVKEAELHQGSRVVSEQYLSDGQSGGFTLNLAQGKYEFYCPDAANEYTPFAVSANPNANADKWKSNPALLKASTDYKTYVAGKVAELKTRTVALQSAIASGDLAAAQKAYAASRSSYELIEPVSESYGDLDTEIDGRAVDFADDPAKFSGFHRIEKGLWEDKSTKGLEPVMSDLLNNITLLKDLVDASDYIPAIMANGATSLLNEINTSKVTGEEEIYSHLDAIDMQSNVDGAMKVVDLLRPALKGHDDLLGTITERQQDLQTLLDGLKATPGEAGSGFSSYEKVDQQTRTSIARSVGALAESVSQIAPIVV